MHFLILKTKKSHSVLITIEEDPAAPEPLAKEDWQVFYEFENNGQLRKYHSSKNEDSPGRWTFVRPANIATLNEKRKLIEEKHCITFYNERLK